MAKKALIISISNYRKFPPLPKITEGSQQLSSLLTKYGFWEVQKYPDHYTNDSDSEFTGNADASDLLETIKSFLLNAQSHHALIYFSGHGFNVQKKYFNTSINEGYLATTYSELNGENSISFRELNQILTTAFDQLSFSSLTLFVDCCNSGLALETFLDVTPKGDCTRHSPWGIIAACQAHQRDHMSFDESYTVFTKFVIEVLQEFADHKIWQLQNASQSVLTFTMLCDSLCTKMKNISKQAVVSRSHNGFEIEVSQTPERVAQTIKNIESEIKEKQKEIEKARQKIELINTQIENINEQLLTINPNAHNAIFSCCQDTLSKLSQNLTKEQAAKEEFENHVQALAKTLSVIQG